jgi:hypothetical protein
MDIMAEYKAERACLDRIKLVLAAGEMSRTDLGRQCSAHSTARVQSVIDGLKSAGQMTETIIRNGRAVRTMLKLSEPASEKPDPLLVRMSPEAVEAQADALARLNGWFIALEADKTNTVLWSARKPMLLAARDILVVLHRTPWKYAAETPVWAVAGDAVDSYGHARAMKALRKLAEMGAIVLNERRGRGKTSTFRLSRVPPYPMA